MSTIAFISLRRVLPIRWKPVLRKRLFPYDVLYPKTRCFYCGSEFTSPKGTKPRTADHVRPKSKGGSMDFNVVSACARCNREKGCLSLKAFRAKRQVDLFYGEEVFLRVATIKLPHVLKELE